MSRRIAGFAVIAGLAFAAATGSAQAADKITAFFPTWPGFAPVYVANQLGYFKEEGLEVVEKFEDDRANVMAAMARGDIDVDMRTVGEHQGRPRDASTPGVIIGTIDMSLGGDGVVGDASVKSFADMKGKVFAVEPNIPARLLAQLELKKVGMTLADLKVKDIATADSIAVFSDPGVSAVATYEPYLSQLLKVTSREKPHILVSSKDYPGIITDIITARNDALKENPEKFRKFLRGVYRAVDFYKKDPAKYIEIAAPHFNLKPAELKEVLDSSLAYTSYEDAVAYLGTKGGTGKLHEVFDTVMQLNLENGAAEHKLDAKQQIDNSVITGLFDGHKR
jgi:NitT/TauT family transport system substrate-binding protein